MAELKTRPTKVPVGTFLGRLTDAGQRADARTLLAIMKRETGETPRMWGSSIIGFGMYRYRYATGRGGDWLRIGFSPRKGHLTVYIMGGLKQYASLLKKLGKHKISGSCLHLKRLDDVHLPTLTKLVAAAYAGSEKLDRA